MAGILVTTGARIEIPEGGFALTLGPNGEPTGSMTLHVSFDMYPHWLRIAVEQARFSKEAAGVVDKVWRDGSQPHEIEALESEMRHSVQACVAAVAALDGFYGTVVDRIADKSRSPKKKGGAARHARVAEIFRQAFKIGPKTSASLRAHLKTMFMLRDEAVHPSGAAREPLPHQRLEVATGRPLATYSARNARNATSSAINIIKMLIDIPKAKNPKLVEHCDFARKWIAPIAEDWGPQPEDHVD